MHWARNQPPHIPHFSDSVPTSEWSSTPTLASRSLGARNKRNSVRVPTPSNAKPVHLRYYENTTRWKELIELAKRLFHIHLVTIDAFPGTVKGLKEAKECLHEAKQSFEEEQVGLED